MNECTGCFLDISSEKLGETIVKHDNYDEIWHLKCYYYQFGGKVVKISEDLDGTKLSHWEEVITEYRMDKRRFNLLLESDFEGDEEALVSYFPELYRHSTKAKIKASLRSRLYNFVKGKNKKSSFDFVGCSIDELKEHLSSQFQNGMSWENYGEWHIDHIKSCASFDLSIEEEQHKCFHYSNLQPLWAIDNLKKGSKEMVR
tara:strand:+ start:5782 stop:6384 length:603 start_codon:yes stop_codon:yes gene_type:complete